MFCFSVYQDESSDELEDVIDDLLVPGSDTDDDWEEKEDDEMEGGEESDDSIEIVQEKNDDDMTSDSDWKVFRLFSLKYIVVLILLTYRLDFFQLIMARWEGWRVHHNVDYTVLDF